MTTDQARRLARERTRRELGVGPPRLLVVAADREARDAVARLARDTLAGDGVSIAVASDAASALVEATGLWAAAVSVEVERADGIELAGRIAAANPSACVVTFAPSYDAYDARRARAVGLRHHLGWRDVARRLPAIWIAHFDWLEREPVLRVDELVRSMLRETDDAGADVAPLPAPPTREQLERALLEWALLWAGDNVAEAAKALAMPRSTLYDLIDAHRIERPVPADASQRIRALAPPPFGALRAAPEPGPDAGSVGRPALPRGGPKSDTPDGD